MCGIAGYFRFSGRVGRDDLGKVERMIEALRHRGPDGGGSIQRGAVSLGHRRLAIIDLSDRGRQPMGNEDGTVWLVFNGEIYNAPALRRELLDAGHRFQSNTDSESILHGYEQWGMHGLLARLRGMFAFALHDCGQARERLFLARDRFGIKPLYYYQNQEGVAFASQTSALAKGGGAPERGNPEALAQFLLWGSMPEPATTIDGVFSLPSGTFAEIGPEGLRIDRYYRLEEVFDRRCGARDAATLEAEVAFIRQTLEETVSIHLVSDAPLGLFLSGGLDSSSLLALAAPLCEAPVSTLSVVFEEAALSEARYADLMADRFACDHHQAPVGSSDFLHDLPRFFAAMDQPSIDGLNTFFVCRAAVRAGLKVMLSGLGADEIFLGYRHLKRAHKHGPLWSLFSRLPEFAKVSFARAAAGTAPLLGKGALERAGSLGNGSTLGLYHLFRGLFSPRRVAELLGADERDVATRLMAVEEETGTLQALICREFDGYLKNQLLRDTDSMSMAHSLEVRVPYLDHILVEAVVSSRPEWRVDPKINKPLLVKALAEDLPRQIWDRPKMGFTLPFDKWLRSYRGELRELAGNGSLDAKAVDRVWADFDSGHAHWSQPWATVVASRWGAP